ncbi:tetratricopeptide repeat protein [Wenzhouxiangella sp. EGI_FJ10305]|uniref:tetratricopeptide repeat protein n=1 Tax=Wenzhouxiangella sp. EGI_FJ10305 TaxID=3243768 RepID=UPI0035DDD278
MDRTDRKPTGRLTPTRRRLLDRLLDDLFDRPENEREAALAQVRQRAPRLGAWLERLLAASTEPGGLLDESARPLVADALDAKTRGSEPALEPGTRLGPWRLTELVGTGGMGEVYRAERADGTFRMQVAVKLIRSHSDDLARLLTYERQTLAMLNHPGIARLLDGGVTEDGRPYLVMDWVEGETLDEWIENQRPEPAEILRIFREACEAVAAAHRELVVHGDIKPANLKVTDSGRVCLLDFGVARLLDRDFQTDLPAAVTPGFAAPEVLEGQSVSTAADIYGLGALLHWLVYGCSPERRADRRVAARWRGYRRRRDLDAIVARATDADPAMRYATVNALALDVGRLREDLPVRARRVGLVERTILWSRRHVVGAALGALAVVLLVGGVSAVAWQARVAAVERDLARAEAARSNALREHLTLLFREVGSLSEDTENLTARELLDRTADVAGEWLANDPDLRQQVNAVLGEIMIALNDYSAAEPLLADFAESDEGTNNPLLHSIALLDMAQVHHRKGRVQPGLAAAEKAVAILESLPGTHPARMSDALQIRGRIRRDLGQWEGALSDLERARELALDVSAGPRPLMARAENNLATTLLIGGRLEAAAQHFEAAEALWLALDRGDASDALSVTANLASVLDRLGRTEEAEQRLKRVIEIRKEQYGPSGAMAAARLNLGRLLVVRGALDEAETNLRRSSEVFARFIGDETPDYAAAQLGLGELAEARGDLERARERYLRSREIMTGLLGERHPYSLQTRLSVLNVRRRLEGEFDPEAYATLAADAEAAGGAARSVLSSITCDRARFEMERGRREAALAQARQCLELRESLGLGGWRITEARALIAAADSPAGPSGEGSSEVIERLAQEMNPDHPAVTWFGRRLSSGS